MPPSEFREDLWCW